MAYRYHTVGFPRSRYRQGPAAGGLLSPDLWQDDRSGRVVPAADEVDDRNDSQEPIAASQKTSDRSRELPDEVIRFYSELDDESRAFLKYGPRLATERLAYAQRVNPLAYLKAELAPSLDQRQFGDEGIVDDSHFVGPDRRVYVRDENSPETYGARIRRGYEQAVGGFTAPTVSSALDEIDEARRSKWADEAPFEPPVSPDEQARQKFLRDQRINPFTWTRTTPMDEDVQRALRETGILMPSVEAFGFVGPDGVAYYRNDIVRESEIGKRRRVREWLEDLHWRQAHPDPDLSELIWKAVAGGMHLPGGRYVGHDGPSAQFVPPGGVAQRAAAQARLAESRILGGGPLPAPKGALRELEDIVAQVQAETSAVPKPRRPNQTREGVTRNRIGSWKSFVDLWDRNGYGNMISPANRFRLKIGLSPKVDKNWIAFMPEDAGLSGQTIEIHHILGLPMTVPLPFTRHRDAHYPGGTGNNPGGPGGQAPFYFEPPSRGSRARKKPAQPRKGST